MTQRSMRADAARNREQILKAARDVIVDLGGDAPLEIIARRAEVGIATLYRRFSTREELLQAVAVEMLTAARELAHSVEREEPSELEMLRRFMHGMLDLKLGALLPVVRGRIHLDATLRELSGEVVERIQAILAAAQEKGDVRGDLAFGDIALTIMRISRPMPAPDFPHDSELAHRQMELYIEGLRLCTGREHRPLSGPAVSGEQFLQLRDHIIDPRNEK